jgi:phosphoenolpyruvate carboxykinase (ATP)
MFGTASEYGLENHGLKQTGDQYWNLPASDLIDQALQRNEGQQLASGAFVALTGQHTGRSPKDKYTVSDETTRDTVWWGSVNLAIDEDQFEQLYSGLIEHFAERDVFVQDVIAGNHPQHNMNVRVITANAWHSLFAQNMFIRLDQQAQNKHIPAFTVLQAPECKADHEALGLNSPTFIAVSFKRRMVLIGGSRYAGEIKKSIFSVMNYLLPDNGVLPMHCSANVSDAGEVALFFGLSGTGKTTLSSDPDRQLIGDDEHGWAEDGVFNFEGGCYAKVIRLREELEPLIYAASQKHGAILENVWVDENGEVDYDNSAYTENTRVSYPIHFLPDIVEAGRAGHPNHIFFLTADAFGVLPPISRLTLEQAMYYFLSGYTSKIAGTERGLGKEPQATFSTCFGAPFLPLHPGIYADMLGERIKEHDASVWLINTGWTGGGYGVGERMHLPYTRRMVSAAMNGELEHAVYQADPVFGLSIPSAVEGVPPKVLKPRDAWTDQADYDRQARMLVERFRENFEQYRSGVTDAIFASGPQE